jgi:hypothetical protein
MVALTMDSVRRFLQTAEIMRSAAKDAAAIGPADGTTRA